ncbi:MAG: hypothetical protein RIK00_05490 [Algiphilus sp.]|uniref:hypothetical protein n=1 Tax=Algiphilus sp. TaxID=1872431 RepID=UPI0032EC8135
MDTNDSRKRPIPSGLRYAARFGTLPDELTREEIFELWFPSEVRRSDSAVRTEATLVWRLLNEALKSGDLHSDLVEGKTYMKEAPEGGWPDAEVKAARAGFASAHSDLLYAQTAPRAAKEPDVRWVHKDSFIEWLNRQDRLSVPQKSPLGAWLGERTPADEPMGPSTGKDVLRDLGEVFRSMGPERTWKAAIAEVHRRHPHISMSAIKTARSRYPELVFPNDGVVADGKVVPIAASE